MAQLMDELFAGGFGGAVGVFVGQPFDFVKVRLQTLGGTRYSGAMDCVQQTLRTEGLLGMYRGVTPPVVNSFALNAITFGGYESGKRMLDGRINSSFWKTFWAGSYAGLLQCAALVPFDLVKCRLQMDRAGTATTKYAGPLDCAVKVVRQEGPLALYRGSGATIARDTWPFGLYFLLYEVLERDLPRRFPSVFGETATTLVSGGVCGAVTWAIAYPIDTIKTREQAMPATAPAAERGALAITRSIIHEHGVGHLYRGLTTCLLRAFPVNAVTFLVYKQTLDLLAQRRGRVS